MSSFNRALIGAIQGLVKACSVGGCASLLGLAAPSKLVDFRADWQEHNMPWHAPAAVWAILRSPEWHRQGWQRKQV